MGYSSDLGDDIMQKKSSFGADFVGTRLDGELTFNETILVTDLEDFDYLWPFLGRDTIGSSLKGVSQFGGKRKWPIFARRKTEILNFLKWKSEF